MTKKNRQKNGTSKSSDNFTEIQKENETRYRTKKQSGIQLQLNWEEENGNVQAKRPAAISSYAGIADLWRERGYQPDVDNSIRFMERQLSDLGQLNFMGSPLTGPAKITSANEHKVLLWHVIDPIIKQYLDYATNGQFSESNPDFGRGRRGVPDSLQDQQGSGAEGSGTTQQGESSDQQRPQDGDLLSGNERVSGKEGIRDNGIRFRGDDDIMESRW